MLAKISRIENSSYERIPINEDGSLSISVLHKHFPNCIGIRYRCTPTGNLRGTRMLNDQLHLPLGISWEDHIFHCVYKDRVKDMNEAEPEKENSLVERFRLETFDMIAVGLPDNITKASFFRYFSKFGILNLCELKRNLRKIKSKSYGFLRYMNFDDQCECIRTDHIIDGTPVSLRIPTAKMDSSMCKRKLFITNITPSVSLEDILEYFSIFGKITQIFMPPVSSPYAFLTFESEDAISRILRFGESHRVFGGYVVVEKVHTRQELQEMNSSRTDIVEPSNEVQYDLNGQDECVNFHETDYENDLRYDSQQSNNQHQHRQLDQTQYEMNQNQYGFESNENIDQNYQYCDQYDRQQNQYDRHQNQYDRHQNQYEGHQNEDQQYQYEGYPSQYDEQKHQPYNLNYHHHQIPYVNNENQAERSYHNDYTLSHHGDSGFDNNYSSKIYNIQPEYNEPPSNFVQDISMNEYPGFVNNLKDSNDPQKPKTLQMNIISDIASSILKQASVPNEKDVLVRLLVDHLSSPRPKIEEKMSKVIRLLQNPTILDNVIRLSENVIFDNEFKSHFHKHSKDLDENN